MATRPISVRVPEHMIRRMRALRAYVAHAADVPCDPHDVTMSDVAKRALAVGIDVMERHRSTDMASGMFVDPSDGDPPRLR